MLDRDDLLRLVVSPEGDAKTDAFVTERIYAFNAAATGYTDAQSFTAAFENGDGEIAAGLTGYTWGGCCYISYLWVAEPYRSKGFGAKLLHAAESHALAKNCRQILLCSHSFQAPSFYLKQGFHQVARIEDYPLGHADIFLAKRLHPHPTSNTGQET